MEKEVVNPNGASAQPVVLPAKKRRTNWWLVVVAALFIIVPFLTWYGTWFGRELSDEKIAEYVADEKNPRHIQHALAQIEQRIEKNDPSVKKFYPQIIAASKSATGEVRKTAAWVMGQDNTSQDFHRALLELLKDQEPLVRRNAALQLVRFGDASGRPELRAMLQSFEVKSPMAGTLISILPVGAKLRAGVMLARIRESGNVQEFRAPVDGEIASVSAKEGDTVTLGQTVATLKPDRTTVLDALRALAYVGTKDDLPVIEASTPIDQSSEIAVQAAAAVKAIRSR
jgi:biotin carboxyl carrier protein